LDGLLEESQKRASEVAKSRMPLSTDPASIPTATATSLAKSHRRVQRVADQKDTAEPKCIIEEEMMI
jgi:hypothetical protein